MRVSLLATKGRPQSRWHQFLDGKTTWQRFVVAVGALAGAVIAIGGLIAGIGALMSGDKTPVAATNRTRAAEDTVVTNQTKEADDFVRFLLGTEGAP